jgi:hypothetical protein
MKAAFRLSWPTLALGLFAALPGCTRNPFGGDDVSSGHREISGVVQLHDGSSPEGVYVWLEGLDVGTYTNEKGEFTISLPAKSGQGPSSGLNGVFNVYYYLANYDLDSTQVVVRDGEFLYSRGDINKDGGLTAPKVLTRFLRITTLVEPSKAPATYSDRIEVQVTLEAASADSATVIVPRSIGGLLGAILVKRTDSQEVFVYEAVPGAQGNLIVQVGASPRTLRMTFNFTLVPLPPGTYEVVPYLLIAHQTIPRTLMQSIGSNVEILGPGYLNIPFRRQGGSLEVN